MSFRSSKKWWRYCAPWSKCYTWNPDLPQPLELRQLSDEEVQEVSLPGGSGPKCNMHQDWQHRCFYVKDWSSLDKLDSCLATTVIKDLWDRNDLGSITFRGTIFFIVAPWLGDLVMKADMSNPFELIPLVCSAAKDFDCKVANVVLPKKMSRHLLIEMILHCGPGA